MAFLRKNLHIFLVIVGWNHLANGQLENMPTYSDAPLTDMDWQDFKGDWYMHAIVRKDVTSLDACGQFTFSDEDDGKFELTVTFKAKSGGKIEKEVIASSTARKSTEDSSEAKYRLSWKVVSADTSLPLLSDNIFRIDYTDYESFAVVSFCSTTSSAISTLILSRDPFAHRNLITKIFSPSLLNGEISISGFDSTGCGFESSDENSHEEL